MRSRIHHDCIQTDERVLEFAKNDISDDALKQILQQEQQDYLQQSIVKAFGWKKIKDLFDEHLETYEHRDLPNIEACVTWAKVLTEKIRIVQKTAVKFQQQLEQIFHSDGPNKYRAASERILLACSFFIREIEEKILTSLSDHIEFMRIKKKTKKYVKLILELKYAVERKKAELQNITNVAKVMYESGNTLDISRTANALQKPVVIDVKPDRKISKSKPEKGETQRISLELFRKGKKIAEIAVERSLAYSTVEGHLAGFISSGEIKILELVEKVKLDKISKLLEEHPAISPSQVRQQLGEEYSYGQIKAAMSYHAITV